MLHFYIRTKGNRSGKGWGMLNRDDTRKMKYTRQVIQEAMRLQPIVQLSYRETVKEFEYGGFTIPKGWRVSL
jgi:cytochrome P450 family 26 subfamily A